MWKTTIHVLMHHVSVQVKIDFCANQKLIEVLVLVHDGASTDLANTSLLDCAQHVKLCIWRCSSLKCPVVLIQKLVLMYSGKKIFQLQVIFVYSPPLYIGETRLLASFHCPLVCGTFEVKLSLHKNTV